MGRFEPAGRLDETIDGLGHRQRPALADDTVEVAPVHVIHDQEMHPSVLVGVLGGHQVEMLEPAGGLDFAAKPHDGVVIARERRREDLQRT